MIYGKDVRLRAIERDDLPRFVSWFNDPEVREGLVQFLPMSLVEEEKWFEDLLSREPVEKPFAIDVLEDEAWVHVGSAGLFTFDHQARRAELGIAIGAKKYWDRGYGTNAVRLLLRHAFDNLNLNRVSLSSFLNPTLERFMCIKRPVLLKRERCASFTFPVESIVIR
jgi:RimJ/RimL family protein N-acetyltransferase